MTEYLNYQSIELAKGLLNFSKGEKVSLNDKKAIAYLKIFGANCFGNKVDSNLQILSCYAGGEHTTSLINPESLILTNPIKAWINERLIQDKNSSVRIGNNALDSDTLFGNFNSWTQMFNGEVGIIKSNQFTPLLIGNLQSMNWDIEKKRNASGFIIRGIRLDNSKAYLFKETAVLR